MTARTAFGDRPVDTSAPDRVRVEAWPDALVDELGFNAEHPCREMVWLPQLGPSALLAWRLLAAALDDCPEGFELDLGGFARTLGLPSGLGRNSPVDRTLRRLVVFGLAAVEDDRTYLVRRRVPPDARHARLRASSSPPLPPPAPRRLRDRIDRGQRRPVTVGRGRAAGGWLPSAN
jgi:hypothetical protein